MEAHVVHVIPCDGSAVHALLPRDLNGAAGRSRALHASGASTHLGQLVRRRHALRPRGAVLLPEDVEVALHHDADLEVALIRTLHRDPQPVRRVLHRRRFGCDHRHARHPDLCVIAARRVASHRRDRGAHLRTGADAGARPHARSRYRDRTHTRAARHDEPCAGELIRKQHARSNGRTAERRVSRHDLIVPQEAEARLSGRCVNRGDGLPHACAVAALPVRRAEVDPGEMQTPNRPKERRGHGRVELPRDDLLAGRRRGAPRPTRRGLLLDVDSAHREPVVRGDRPRIGAVRRPIRAVHLEATHRIDGRRRKVAREEVRRVRRRRVDLRLSCARVLIRDVRHAAPRLVHSHAGADTREELHTVRRGGALHERGGRAYLHPCAILGIASRPWRVPCRRAPVVAAHETASHRDAEPNARRRCGRVHRRDRHGTRHVEQRDRRRRGNDRGFEAVRSSHAGADTHRRSTRRHGHPRFRDHALSHRARGRSRPRRGVTDATRYRHARGGQRDSRSARGGVCPARRVLHVGQIVG